ncbi:unnamed protein product [Ranitomeya imitator]|uniref:ATP synthase n=1 Tax=Ranitomeya imitator TaxID=111125 RepID=A0ABN9LIG5_9NEOB|nr:unnamed protein product [Ranitomeya imitator]
MSTGASDCERVYRSVGLRACLPECRDCERVHRSVGTASVSTGVSGLRACPPECRDCERVHRSVGTASVSTGVSGLRACPPECRDCERVHQSVGTASVSTGVYSYMIDNVILLITGTLHQRSISELVPKCHPLGRFEQMEAVNIAQTPAELYNAILVDTPLAAFFQDCISEQDLDEMNIEIIRNTLYKAYLESFYKFCDNLGGTTADVMCPILEFEADRRAFIITINSFGTELSKEDRAKLFPHCGKLYPEGLAQLARADDYEQVKTVADYYPEYKLLFEGAGNNPGDKTLEDKFFEHEVTIG